MSKLVEAEWQRHSVTMGIPLPRLTASKNRKLAITVHREGGATREEQTQNQLYVHVGDGSVDHAIFVSVDYEISNFLGRFRCFCYIISMFICISILDHAGFI
jgi:hypothetical protein